MEIYAISALCVAVLVSLMIKFNGLKNSLTSITFMFGGLMLESAFLSITPQISSLFSFISNLVLVVVLAIMIIYIEGLRKALKPLAILMTSVIIAAGIIFSVV